MTVTFWGQEFKVNIFIGCIGGFLIAIVSSMFGFGGGPFMTPLLAVGLGLPMYLVVGSSLLAIFFNTVMASMRHYQFGNFDGTFFLIMFIPAILAGFIAPQIAKRISPLWVKRVAVVGLLILASQLLGLI
ncbi:MAG TPA: sulfite exporter TauE/SafE family protein [Dissulfurispiraceae bacterium]|nr:sulfite exporter TauE/SafE family protein [Dissulfurispiraceae bacterium]